MLDSLPEGHVDLGLESCLGHGIVMSTVTDVLLAIRLSVRLTVVEIQGIILALVSETQSLLEPLQDPVSEAPRVSLTKELSQRVPGEGHRVRETNHWSHVPYDESQAPLNVEIASRDPRTEPIQNCLEVLFGEQLLRLNGSELWEVSQFSVEVPLEHVSWP